FADEDARQLRFATNRPELDIVRVRSFDVATFVAFGGAQLGVIGGDVLAEFDYPEIYAPLDLGIGKCRLVVAEPADMAGTDDPSTWSSVSVATKYPSLTQRHFARRGVQAECIRLSGAMELAPSLGLSRRIVDLVATGETLKANGLVEVERIMDVTSKLAVNRTAWKTRPEEIGGWIDRFRKALNGTA
ncbi:MAG: ATP phosphoribosyltransferase, partial [Alphaproteobacteria bacterium]|nr:ATP phosphoribosyltransferase [Alphaproteobacteria bacterium]